MTERRVLTGVLVFLMTAAGAGCDRVPESQRAGGRRPAAARVGDETIAVEDLRRYLAGRLAEGAATVDVVSVQRYLQELVTIKSLAREARRQGLDQAPDVRLAVEQLLGTRLLEREVRTPVVARKVAPEEIAAFYARHKTDYSRPEQVRLGDIFVAVAENAGEDVRRKRKRKAERILREAQDAAGTRNGFARLVRQYSEPHPLYSTGDTGYFDRQGRPAGLDPALVEAAFSLVRKGDIRPKVVETPIGFHIVMLVGRRAAVERPVDELAAEIEQRIKNEELKRKRREYVQMVSAAATVKIDRAQLEALAAEYSPADGRSAVEGMQKSESGTSGGNRPPGVPQE